MTQAHFRLTRRRSLPLISSLYANRQFVFGNALLEMRHRYAGTSMGILWHVIQPLTLILVFTLVFSGIIPTRPGPSGAPVESFALRLAAGLLPWVAFSDSVVRCTTALTDNAHYLRKISIDEWLFVARAAVTSALMMLISVAIVLLAALVLGTPARVSWVVVPVAGLLFSLFGFGIGLLLSPIHVFLRDTGQLIGLVLQFVMWLSPVILTEAALPAGLRAAQDFNPVAWYLRAVRGALFDGTVPDITGWILMIIAPLVLIVVGQRLLFRMRSDVRDVI